MLTIDNQKGWRAQMASINKLVMHLFFNCVDLQYSLPLTYYSGHASLCHSHSNTYHEDLTTTVIVMTMDLIRPSNYFHHLDLLYSYDNLPILLVCEKANSCNHFLKLNWYRSGTKFSPGAFNRNQYQSCCVSHKFTIGTQTRGGFQRIQRPDDKEQIENKIIIQI